MIKSFYYELLLNYHTLFERKTVEYSQKKHQMKMLAFLLEAWYKL